MKTFLTKKNKIVEKKNFTILSVNELFKIRGGDPPDPPPPPPGGGDGDIVEPD
jgi:hypothetical protein